MTVSLVEDVLAFHDSLWLPTLCDVPEAIRATERRLGMALPGLLAAVYARTSLRNSSSLHLSELADLHVRDGFISIGHNHPGNNKYAVRVADAALDDPPVFVADTGPMRPEDCTLSEFLRLFWVVNRPDERPYALLNLTEPLELNWRGFEFAGRTLHVPRGAYCFSERYVLQMDWDCIGARTDHALFMILVRLDQLRAADVFWTDAVGG